MMSTHQSNLARATAMDLPNELWLEIFHLLDYPTLKQFPLVSKRFFILLQKTSEDSKSKLDMILFRDAPAKFEGFFEQVLQDLQNKGKNHDTLLHPFLSIYCSLDGPKAVRFLATTLGRINERTVDRIFQTFLGPMGEGRAVWEENAISPAAGGITLCIAKMMTRLGAFMMNLGDLWPIDNDSVYEFEEVYRLEIRAPEACGVTVFDVMVALLLLGYRTHSNIPPTYGSDHGRVYKHTDTIEEPCYAEEAVKWMALRIKASLVSQHLDEQMVVVMASFDHQLEVLKHKMAGYKLTSCMAHGWLTLTREI